MREYDPLKLTILGVQHDLDGGTELFLRALIPAVVESTDLEEIQSGI